MIGLDGTKKVLDTLPQTERVKRIQRFVHDARLALAQTGDALHATAAPIQLVELPQRGRTASLSAQVQSYALGLTITFLSLVLAAGALAGERDENVLGRLARGLVPPGRLVAAKVALAGIVATVLGLGVAFAFAAVIVIGDAPGGEPWGRLPLLAAGLALTGAALGALGSLVGALAREARTASLVAVLLVLPIVFLGLIPPEVFAAAGWVSDGAAVRARRAALLRDALRPASVGRGRARGGLARRARRALLAARPQRCATIPAMTLSGDTPAAPAADGRAARPRARDDAVGRRPRDAALRRARGAAERAPAGARRATRSTASCARSRSSSASASRR